jgi:hypothetical protein
MSSSPTKHNRSVGPARSLFLETGFRQPTTGAYAQYTERVRQIASEIIDGFGLSQTQIDYLRGAPLANDAMARQVPNQLAPEWTVALQVISAPELYGSAETIEHVNATVIRNCSRLFAEFGLSADAIATGFTEAGNELSRTTA